MRTLGEIAEEVREVTLHGDPATIVTGITNDSRQVRQGFIYAVVRGATVDGAAFIPAALAAGAAAILSDRAHDVEVPLLQTDDVRDALGPVAASCFGNPGAAMRLVGVTGTNGKTTITWLVESILSSVAMPCGVMGTIEYRFGRRVWPASHTTPEAPVIQSILRDMRDAGAVAVAMETSSHGLVQGRLRGCVFDVAAFTNLTQDHLDFHATMEEYGAAKMHLFTRHVSSGRHSKVVVNLDDPFAAQIMSATAVPVCTVSCDPHSGADFCPLVEPGYAIDGIHTDIATPAGIVCLDSPLVGRHNLNNLLVAAAIGWCLDIPMEAITSALAARATVPGRLERVDYPGGCAVFVDYAHTPDALERVLGALRPLTAGRLFCVFGCGGDRDAGKRPLMGAAVAERADVAIATSDNPRTEDPDRILDMVEEGLRQAGAQRLAEPDAATENGYLRILDRRAAIGLAIRLAKPGDTVLIAGKGHEDYLIIGTQKTHFDDREVAREAIFVQSGKRMS
jgi:UDP-N-acetylmuramoyl-L-alanyl-D-glutamate--2,6-diaminopimelate ligase